MENVQFSLVGCVLGVDTTVQTTQSIAEYFTYHRNPTRRVGKFQAASSFLHKVGNMYWSSDPSCLLVLAPTSHAVIDMLLYIKSLHLIKTKIVLFENRTERCQ